MDSNTSLRVEVAAALNRAKNSRLSLTDQERDRVFFNVLAFHLNAPTHEGPYIKLLELLLRQLLTKSSVEDLLPKIEEVVSNPQLKSGRLEKCMGMSPLSFLYNVVKNYTRAVQNTSSVLFAKAFVVPPPQNLAEVTQGLQRLTAHIEETTAHIASMEEALDVCLYITSLLDERKIGLLEHELALRNVTAKTKGYSGL